MRTLLISAAVLLAAVVPSAAQDNSGAAVDYAAMSDDALRDYLRANADEVLRRPCDAVSLFAELGKREPASAPYARGLIVMQAYCAAEQGKHTEGLALVHQAEREHDVQGLDQLGLFFGMRTADAQEVLLRLQALARSGQLADFQRDYVFEVFRTIRRAGMDDDLGALAAEVTGMDVFPRLEPNVRASLASGALRHAAKAGDLSGTERLLAEIRSPTSYIGLLESRDYEPMWLAIERHAGDHLANVSDRYVAWAAQWLADAPEDRDRLSEYARALLFAGRFEEAVDLTRGWLGDPAGYEGIEEGDAWALNIEAYALDRLGRHAEADRVFDRLAALPADEHPWVVNFVINRASRLVGHERWEEGLEATALARSVAEEYGSTYAKMLIARDRACALHRLGRPAEAEGEIAYLVASFNEAGHVAATGLLCAGEDERVAELIAVAFADVVAKRILTTEMQDERFELFYTASTLPRARDLILARDNLREAALAEVRILPERLVPEANLRATATGQAEVAP